MTLLNNLQNIQKKFLIEIIPDFQRYSFSAILHLTMQRNTSILSATIQYIFDTKRFEVPLTNL